MQGSGVSESGQIHIFNGFDGTHLFSITSPNPGINGHFGHSIAAIEDINGDAVSDLLAGAIGEEYSHGRAYVFSGANGEFLHTLLSPDTALFSNFGESVTGIADINNDGFVEMLVGVPYTEFVPWYAGSAHIFDGFSGNLLQTLYSPDPREIAYFGFPVKGVFDLSGDGITDFVVGAHHENFGKGRIYVYSLSSLAVDEPPDDALSFPGEMRLEANYPNPFNPSTSIRYSLPISEWVSITIYDLHCRRVRTLTSDYILGGEHVVVWNGVDDENRQVASGIYLCLFKAGAHEVTRKMVLAR